MHTPESGVTPSEKTPSRRTLRQSPPPSETAAAVTPSRRRTKPRETLEATGAEEAQKRYETVGRLTKGKELEPPDIMSDMIPEMDHFFGLEKVKDEGVFELTFYKLHEDLQQAIMEYRLRVDWLKAKKRPLTDEEQMVLQDFQGQIDHLSKIFASFTDNAAQSKQDAVDAYRSYFAWRQEGQTKALAEYEERESRKPKKAKSYAGEPAALREKYVAYEKFDDTPSMDRVNKAVDAFLALPKISETDIKDLRQELRAVSNLFTDLEERVSKAKAQSKEKADIKNTDFLGTLEAEHFNRRMLLLDLESAVRENYRKNAEMGLENPEKIKTALRAALKRESIRQVEAHAKPETGRIWEPEAIAEAAKERERSLKHDEKELAKQEAELRAKIAEAFGMQPESLANRRQAIYGQIEEWQNGPKGGLKAKSFIAGLYNKTLSYLTMLARGESRKKVQPATYREAREMAREITRIQAERSYIHDQLMGFEDYRQETLQAIEETNRALAEAQRQAETEEGRVGQMVETGLGEAKEGMEIAPAFSVEWTKANFKDAAREWDEMAPLIQRHNLGPQIREIANGVSDKAFDYEELSPDYSALRHLTETVKANELYAGCPECAMAISLEALPKPKLETDRRVKEAADKAVAAIKKLIADAKASEPVELAEEEIEAVPEKEKAPPPPSQTERQMRLEARRVVDEFEAFATETMDTDKLNKRRLGLFIGRIRKLTHDEKGGYLDKVNAMAKLFSSFESEWTTAQNLVENFTPAQRKIYDSLSPEERKEEIDAQRSNILSRWLEDWVNETGIELPQLRRSIENIGQVKEARPEMTMKHPQLKAMPPLLEDVMEVSEDELLPPVTFDTEALLDEFKSREKAEKRNRQAEMQAVRQEIKKLNLQLELLRQSRAELKKSLKADVEAKAERRQHAREEEAIKNYDAEIAKLEAAVAELKSRLSPKSKKTVIEATPATAPATEATEELEELEPEEEASASPSKKAPPPPSAEEREARLDLQAAISGRPRHKKAEAAADESVDVELPEEWTKAPAHVEPDIFAQPKTAMNLLEQRDKILDEGWYGQILRNNPLIAKHADNPEMAAALDDVRSLLFVFDERKKVAKTNKAFRSLAIARSEAMLKAEDELKALAEKLEHPKEESIDVELPSEWNEAPTEPGTLSEKDRQAILELLPEKARPGYEKLLDGYLAAIKADDRKAIMRASEDLVGIHLKYKVASEDPALKVMGLAIEARRSKAKKPRTSRARTLRGGMDRAA